MKKLTARKAIAIHNEAQKAKLKGASEHLVRCKKCYCETDVYDTKEEATEAWNRRYKEQDDENTD